MKEQARTRSLTVLFAPLAAMILAGCASSHQYRVITPLATAIQAHREIFVLMSHPGEDPSTLDERDMLTVETRRALEQADRIVSVLDETQRHDAKGIVLELCVTRIARVTHAKRFWLGAMAGRASVEVQVRLLDPKTAAVLGSATITGTSSGGTIFAGTTDDAIIEAAKAVAEFVSSNM